MVCYADYLALVVILKHLEDAELYSCQVISSTETWLESLGLMLAQEKLEAVLITKLRKWNYARIKIEITAKSVIKYLGAIS